MALSGLVFCFQYFQKNESVKKRNFGYEFLQNASHDEKEFYSKVCHELFYNSTVGYTLFGDKPVSVINGFDRPGGGRRYFFLKLALPLLRKYEKKLRSNSFIVVFEEDSNGSSLYLVNKKAFLNTIQHNILIFQKILGVAITPKKLLKSLENKTSTFEMTLKRSHLLFGILFGYGIENAMHFERRLQLEHFQYKQGFPPWKDPHNLEGMERDEVVLFNERRKDVIKAEQKKPVQEKFISLSGHLKIQDELFDLNKKLSFVGGSASPPRVSSSIDLPSFVGDPQSEETKKLLEEYVRQNAVLRQIDQDGKMLDNVLEKFYESPED